MRIQSISKLMIVGFVIAVVTIPRAANAFGVLPVAYYIPFDLGILPVEYYYPLVLGESLVTDDKAAKMGFGPGCWLDSRDDLTPWYETPLNNYILFSPRRGFGTFVARFLHLKKNFYVAEFDFEDEPGGVLILVRADEDSLDLLYSDAADFALKGLLESHEIYGEPIPPGFEVSSYKPDLLVDYMLEVLALPTMSENLMRRGTEEECRLATDKN